MSEYRYDTFGERIFSNQTPSDERFLYEVELINAISFIQFYVAFACIFFSFFGFFTCSLGWILHETVRLSE